MEHVNYAQVTAPFYAVADANGAVTVRQAKPARTVAVIPHDINGLPASEGWKWGTRISRALCYDAVSGRRVRSAGWTGFWAGLALGGVAMWAFMLGLGYVPPSQCVDVGDYITVPNG